MKQFDENLKKSQEELKRFADFVLRWQKSVNLISPSTISDIWERHIVDSAQLFEYIPMDAKIMVDMGSGGGFPALVLAIVNKVCCGPIKRFYLIESDIKKSIFLREAVREFDVPATVLNKRIENVVLEDVDVVTARALKPVEEMLSLGRHIINSHTICLFLKGEQVDEELKKNTYKCSVEKIPSCTHSKASILKIGGIQYE